MLITFGARLLIASNSFWKCLSWSCNLQEIDGNALLLLKSDMIMKYLGLKLGPALKLCYHIDKLKQSRFWSADPGSSVAAIVPLPLSLPSQAAPVPPTLTAVTCHFLSVWLVSNCGPHIISLRLCIGVIMWQKHKLCITYRSFMST